VRRIIDVNLFGTGMLIERYAPGMAERGWGRIVVIASEWGVNRLGQRHGVRGIEGRAHQLGEERCASPGRSRGGP
jgi:NAD(P)-dependent dehydrogenase (short-subunit alcohol dehydrogenase family)